jgi:hypothetical protein
MAADQQYQDLAQKYRSEIVRDYQICKSDGINGSVLIDKLSNNMDNMFKYGLMQVNHIGQKNFKIVINWASCLVKYSTDGGDEELGNDIRLCKEYSDSLEFRKTLKFLAKTNTDAKNFRNYLIKYGATFQVKCS